MAIIIFSIQAKNHINHIEDDNDHGRDDVGWKDGGEKEQMMLMMMIMIIRMIRMLIK